MPISIKVNILMMPLSVSSFCVIMKQALINSILDHLCAELYTRECVILH